MMNMAMIAQTIQVIVAPVVMVTACGLLLNSLVPRYGSINDRLRLLSRERIDLVRAPAHGAFEQERLSVIDVQMPDLLSRHKQLHDAILLVYGAAFVFIGSMFVIAAATATQSLTVANIALALFLVGTGVLLVGLLTVMREVRRSHVALHYEAMHALQLTLKVKD